MSRVGGYFSACKRCIARKGDDPLCASCDHNWSVIDSLYNEHKMWREEALEQSRTKHIYHSKYIRMASIAAFLFLFNVIAYIGWAMFPKFFM